MREAAITAGLVRSVGARDRDWRDRLRIITYVFSIYPRSIPNQVSSFFFFSFLQFSEPEAAAVHCAHLTDLHKLKPSQIFMICDAGGGTVVRLELTLFDPPLARLTLAVFSLNRILRFIKFWVSCQTLR